MKLKLLLSAIVGIVCGLISVRFLAGSWLNLAFWGVVGVILGYIINSNARTVWSGAVYGFVLTATFQIGSFQGTSDKWPGFLLLTLMLGILGAVCGLIFCDIGGWIRKN